MTDLIQIGAAGQADAKIAAPVGARVAARIPSSGAGARRPEWLRVRVTHSQSFAAVGELMRGLALTTVCEEARCPNIWECWGEHRTATFMILGDICTRACRYCSVTSGKPRPVTDLDIAAEPQHVAEAVAHLNLAHAVITSVDRDDLEDFGSRHFAATIAAVRARQPDCRVEVLIPDFDGDATALGRVLDAGPNVVGHNIETMPRLFPNLRARGDYRRSLEVLSRADRRRRETGEGWVTKSGLMVGLGETEAEIFAVMDDLRDVHCDVLTIGQYLNPTKKHAPIARFYTPEEFAALGARAKAVGFRHCESGPLVRSSYRAHLHGHPVP